MDDPDLLTTREAAELVRRTPETIIRWVLHEGLAAVRVKTRNGFRYLVSRKALLDRLEHVQTPEPARVTLRNLRTEATLREFGLA